MGGLATFGRDEELDTIRSFSSEDGPAALVLEGEAGIGKTTLWQAAVDAEAAAGRTLLVARPSQAEATLGFSGLTDLFDGAAEGAADLPEPQAQALSAALLQRADDAGVDLRALSAAVLGVLRSLVGKQPVTVAIDDIQWLDEATASVLAFAARRLTDEPIHLVVALRTTVARDDSPLLDAAPVNTTRVSVGPLSSGALHRAITQHLGESLPRPLLLRVHEVSGGNPFYALEVARSLKTRDVAGASAHLELPSNLQSLVQERLRRLPKPVQRAIELAALIADPIVQQLEAVSKEPERLAVRLDQAEAAGVIVLDGDHVRFTHPLLAEGAASLIGPRRRLELHAELAAIIDDPEERANHLGLATTDSNATVAATIEEGARVALQRGVPASAAHLYERAAELTLSADDGERFRRTMEAASACAAAGLEARGKQLIENCLKGLPPGLQRSDALFVLCELLADDFPAARRALDEAIENAGEDAARLSVLLRERSNFLFVSTGDVDLALHESRAALEEAQRLGEVDLTRWIAEVSFHETIAGRITQGLLEGALERDRAADLPILADSPQWVQALRFLYVDRLDDSRALLQEELVEAERHGEEGYFSGLLTHLTEVECRAGNFGAAGEYANEAWARQEQRGEVYQGGTALYARALAAAHTGQVDEARAAAQRGIAISEQIGDSVFEKQSKAVLGFLELSLGDATAADEVLRPLPLWLVEHGWDEPSVCPGAWPNSIEALVVVGELALAREYLDQYRERAERCDCPLALASSARCLGLLRSAEGDMDGAFVAFEQSLVDHRRVPGPHERGRTLLSYGVALRRAKRRGDARARMEEALAVFDEVGARLWAERARAELARVGGRQRSGNELTPTEEQIARLVAAGASNADVAAELFVSVRTVESNLTRIYGKLGLKSRTELAAQFNAAESSTT
jgi:DNA-binding CsgD family transcriptional regulator